MSSPPNILDQFQSYSYDFLLCVSDNTEALRTFHSGEEVTSDDILAAKQGATFKTSEGSVKIIVDSRLTSAFVIDGLSFKNYMMSPNSPRHMFSDINMQMREPGGARFLNYLEEVKKQTFGASINNLFFSLVITFNGWSTNQAGAGEWDSGHKIIPMKPMYMIMEKLSVSFGESGGMYVMSFLDAANGAAFGRDKLNKVKYNKNVFSENGTLGAAIESFQDKLNLQMREEYLRHNKVNEDLVKDKAQEGDTASDFLATLEKPYGKLVQYDINIPSFWKGHKITGNEDTPGKGITLNSPREATVDTIIDNIMKSSEQLHQQLIPKSKESGDYKYYVITSTVTSNSEVYTIHYDVKMHISLAAKTSNDPDARPTDLDPGKWGIEFNYIFTGLNTDITSLEMKLEDGLSYFTSRTAVQDEVMNKSGAAETPTLIEDGADEASGIKNTTHDNSEGEVAEATVKIGTNEPIYSGELIKEVKNGSLNKSKAHVQSLQDYTKSIGAYAAVSNNFTTIGIRGNPLFFNAVIKEMIPHNTYHEALERIQTDATGGNADGKGGLVGSIVDGEGSVFERDTEGGTVSQAGSNFDYLPLLVKINIEMPRVDRESGESFTESDGGQDTFAEPFWYDGWYKVYEVESSFSDGSFDQKLTMAIHDLHDPNGNNTVHTKKITNQ